MNKLFLIILSIVAIVFPQNVDSSFNSLFQKENVIKFADYLFCEKDYLRSANEYLRIDKTLRDEKINFKIALSFSIVGDFVSAKNIFERMTGSSPYYKSSRLELMKIFFLEEKYPELREFFQVGNDKIILQNEPTANKLYYISYLKDSEEIPSFNDFVKPYDFSEQDEINTLYKMKINPPNKNPFSASLLSAIIPGAGKIYTGEISDGIFAFITTGLFSLGNLHGQYDYGGKVFCEEKYFDGITQFKRVQFFDSLNQYSFLSNKLIGMSYKQGGKLNEAINYFSKAELNSPNDDSLFTVKLEIIKTNLLRRTIYRAFNLLNELSGDARFNSKKDQIIYWKGWAYIFNDEWKKAADEFDKLEGEPELKKLCENVSNDQYSPT